MGISSKKTKTKSTSQEQSHQVQTATNSPFLEPMMASFAERINGFSGLNPQSLVAPQSALETQAFQATSQRLAQPNPAYAEAMANIRALAAAPVPLASAVQGPSGAGATAGVGYENIRRYMDPFEQQELNAHYADIDHQAAVADAQARAQATSAGAWSGNGAEVLRGIVNANYSRDRAVTGANLRAAGWNAALGASGADADRVTQASIASANNATQADISRAQLAQQIELANQQAREAALGRQLSAAGQIGDYGQRQDAAVQAAIQQAGELGATQREISQAQATAPLTLLQSQIGLLGQLPLNLTHGQVTDGTGSSNSTSTTTVSDPMGGFTSLLGGLSQIGFGLPNGPWGRR